MAIIHPVGKPTDGCERRVIAYLQEYLADEYHIYHNLEFTPKRQGGHPYEYDLIVVGKYLVWVVEVKGYRGRIWGNAAWLHFANGRTVSNPVPLTNQKARVLASVLEGFAPHLRANKKRSSGYVDSLIALCDDNVQIYLPDDPQASRFLHLQELVQYIQNAALYADLNCSEEEEIGHTICQFLEQRFGPIRKEKQIGDYTILGPIVQRSKRSVTYPAKHTLLGTRVALKIYHLNVVKSTGSIQEQKRLLIRDARILSKLDDYPHVNIARCYPPFLVNSDQIATPLEWIDGITLEEHLEVNTPLTLAQRLDIFRQLIQGLAHAHNLGVVHRQVSPKNIVISSDNVVKLVNFQFAKVDPWLLSSGTNVTVVGEWLGQADWRYTAPELCQPDGKASPVTDLFSAGVMLYKLVTGQFPFSDTRTLQSSTNLPLMSAINPELDSGWDIIFQYMCKFKANERFSSMQDLLKTLPVIDS
jgi:hypothetical protein